jgi:threonine dehydrogenase-like Zn-dependent dehydrogenase
MPMRAVLYTGNRTMTVADRDQQPPGPGHVWIEVAYTGSCGTDGHIFHGAMDHRVATPAVIGHGSRASDYVHGALLPVDGEWLSR